MRKVRLYMVLQWLVFFPIILPLCVIFGALQGAIQMAERVINQLWTDIASNNKSLSSTLPTNE